MPQLKQTWLPTYRSKCASCDVLIDYTRRIADRDDTPTCEDCGAKTERVLVAPMVPVMGIADHYAIKAGNGRTYYGRHEYEKYLKANGVLPSSELKGEAEHQRANNAQEIKRERRKDIVDAVRALGN